MIEEDDEFKVFFLDESEGEFSEEEFDFIDDKDGEEQEERSFYRSADNNEAVKFSNQTKNPHEVADESEDEYYGEDDMPELFDPEHREDVEFDLFDSSHDKSQFLKNSLKRFKDVDNQFFYAVIYGVMHYRLNGRNITLENAENVLGPKFFIELKNIENVSMLDHSIFGFFDRCREMNNVLSEFGFFF